MSVHTRARSSRWRRAVGLALLLTGVAVLGWVGFQELERRAAQSRGRLELAAGAGELPPQEGGEPAAEPVPDSVSRPQPGSVVARIVIPGAGVDTIAFEGIDRTTLERGAGHFPGTALPGRPGNAGFAAHRDSDFRGLRQVAAGDEIYVESGDGVFHYRVSQLRVVEPSQVEVVAWRGRNELTLVTCYPFDYVGPAPRRFVVHAELVAAAQAGGALLPIVGF